MMQSFHNKAMQQRVGHVPACSHALVLLCSDFSGTRVVSQAHLHQQTTRLNNKAIQYESKTFTGTEVIPFNNTPQIAVHRIVPSDFTNPRVEPSNIQEVKVEGDRVMVMAKGLQLERRNSTVGPLSGFDEWRRERSMRQELQRRTAAYVRSLIHPSTTRSPLVKC